jgi:L-lactate dehydrogenase (cytochrome)
MSVIDTLRSVLAFRRLELDPVKRHLDFAADVEDLRRLAKRRLPAGVFDYIDGAAEDEVTAQRNVAGFKEIEFRPRVLRDVAKINLETTLFGRPLAFPLVLSPTGFTRIADPAGELAVARAAERAGLAYTLSTLATRSIEEVASVSTAGTARNWFQVYVWRDRGLVKALLERAREANYEAIVLTVDNAVLGRRARDVRRGFTLPPTVGLETLIDGALHPGWTLDLLRSEPISFANLTGSGVGDGSSPVLLSDYINSQFDASLSWSEIEWFRANWSGPIVIKGIQTLEDAKLAHAHALDAIALSNHGGRQLDGAPSPIDLLASVANELGGQVPILCDGGIRRGSDIVKALALGASAAMIGRAYLYGLGAGGERGVDHVLGLLASGMSRTMALLGCSSIGELDASTIARHKEVEPR